MYIIFRRDYYKLCFSLGFIWCIICGIVVYYLIVVCNHSWNFTLLMSLFISIIFSLYFLIKYLRKDLDFATLRIDDNGMFLCSKKDEGTYIPWEKIKLVIFVVANNGSKIIIRQHNKETCEFLLAHYFHCFRPKGAINAAYKYADDKKKIREVKDSLALDYETIMWRISKTEVKHEKEM